MNCDVASDPKARWNAGHWAEGTVAAERGVDRFVVAQLPHQLGEQRGAQERQPAAAIVIGQGAERLGPQGHVRVEFVACGRIPGRRIPV